MVHRDTRPPVNFLVMKNMVPVAGERNRDRKKSRQTVIYSRPGQQQVDRSCYCPTRSHGMVTPKRKHSNILLPCCVLLSWEIHGLNEDKTVTGGSGPLPGSASPECAPLHILATEPHVDTLL